MKNIYLATYNYVKEHPVSSVLDCIQLMSVAKMTPAEVQEETVIEPVTEVMRQETTRGSEVSLGGSSLYFFNSRLMTPG